MLGGVDGVLIVSVLWIGFFGAVAAVVYAVRGRGSRGSGARERDVAAGPTTAGSYPATSAPAPVERTPEVAIPPSSPPGPSTPVVPLTPDQVASPAPEPAGPSTHPASPTLAGSPTQPAAPAATSGSPAPPHPSVPVVSRTEELRRIRGEVEEELRSVRDDIREQRMDLERREHRVTEREERLDGESRHLEERARDLAHQHADLDLRQAELADRRAELADLEEERRLVLERTAGLTAEEARAELVAQVENQAKRDAALIVRDIEREATTEGEVRARRIIVGAIQRLATEQTTESVVSVLHLPSDDMKGRIIGREGRNIRTFETVTGVNLIIDDTPEAVLLSCFDPVRREIGRITLEALVLDGRIHPQRIEDAHERAKAEVEALCVRAGEDALVDVGITDLHPALTVLMGRLRYRTSYGQNVLMHLLESAHVAGMMASELGLDPVLMRRCALLHDIGKALTHEVEGSHAIIGAEVARRYGESDDVVHAIEAHHNEVEPRTVEAVLTQAADAISGGRPGARRESLEAYVKRLERLEEIAGSYTGVEKVFAMQAGREVRVMVLPEEVDDIQAQVIAREIAKQVEHELTYPGQIRVTVVRESRATEVAR